MPGHTHLPLHPLEAAPLAPAGDTWHVRLDAPARSVMTDFTERNLVTVDPGLPIDAALQVMKHAGVRSAFVLDEPRGRVLGFVTAHDIMGEKPIQHLQAIGCTHLTCTRDDVKVEDLMERPAAWRVLRHEELEHATVGAVLEALDRAGRTHLPVVEAGGRLRGVFSRAKLLRLTRASRPGVAA